MKLSEVAFYVTDKISSSAISKEEYVTTECIRQNKQGSEIATNLPPQTCSLTKFKAGDVLVANIRPYLKKIWYADTNGGASSDVLVFRAKGNHSSDYLYSILLQDAFYEYVMLGTKGSKMPRGDKEQIMRYSLPTLSSSSEESVGRFFLNLENKISLNRAINQNLFYYMNLGSIRYIAHTQSDTFHLISAPSSIVFIISASTSAPSGSPNFSRNRCGKIRYLLC